MKISPSVLSWPLLLLSMLWVGSNVVYGVHLFRSDLGAVPWFCLVLYAVGGPIVLFLALVLVTARRNDKSRFETIDRAALMIAGIGAIIFSTMLILSWL